MRAPSHLRRCARAGVVVQLSGWAGLLLATAPTPLSAQHHEPVALQRQLAVQGAVAAGRTPGPLRDSLDRAPPPWILPLPSLLVPGTSQALLKQKRAVAYLALEGYLLFRATSAQRSGNLDRASYHRLAAEVARAPFGGPLPEGSWEYYEAMKAYVESGRFDMSPGGVLQPETDERTFNGAQWLLARETFWQDAQASPGVWSDEYQRALAFYAQRAVRDEFRWSWQDAPEKQALYRETITSANRNYKRAMHLAGAVAANHLLSVFDAYMAVRLRRSGREQPWAGAVLTPGVRFVEGVTGSGVNPMVRLTVPFSLESPPW
jgi:hypothetical protein